MIDFIQVLDTPLEQMSLEEMKAERSAHAWVRYKLNAMVSHLTMRLHWLKENKPYVPKEEYTRMYENGELSAKEYRLMAEKAQQEAVVHFSNEAYVDGVYSLYKKIMDAKRN